jgi:hypothetical protein
MKMKKMKMKKKMEEHRGSSEWLDLERRIVEQWPRLHEELQRLAELQRSSCNADADSDGEVINPHAPAAALDDKDDDNDDESKLAADYAKPQGGDDHAIASEDGRSSSCGLSNAQLACVVDACFPATGDGDSASVVGNDKQQRQRQRRQLDGRVLKLAEWLFMEPGPHGCLAFLINNGELAESLDSAAAAAAAMTKAQVFGTLAPGVMLRMLSGRAGRALVHELRWTQRHWICIQHALLCVATVSLSSSLHHKTVAAAAAQVAPALVSCLAFLVGTRNKGHCLQAGILVAVLSRSGDAELAIGTRARTHDPRHRLCACECANVNAINARLCSAGIRLARALGGASVDHLPRAVKDGLVGLIAESEHARVRLAAVQCLAGSVLRMEPTSLSVRKCSLQ